MSCGALDSCHEAGRCEPVTGMCSFLRKVDGTSCDDGDACTEADLCFGGECVSDPLPDGDEDGVCDAVDLCPTLPDPGQEDQNGISLTPGLSPTRK